MKNASLIEAIFSRSKIQPVFTHLWKAVPISIENAISTRIDFNTIEQPIICLYINSNKWWLITTERIILNYDSIQNIYLCDVTNIKLNKLFDESISKLDINTIQLEISNNYFDLEVEKRTWHVIYKMLKFMIKKW